MEKRIILASASPRRRELLEMLDIDFEIMADNTPETMPVNCSPDEVVRRLAEFKGDNVCTSLGEGCDAIVISADTVVSVDGKILGKPKSEEQAEQMLSCLSGRSHDVYTGVCIKDICTKKTIIFCEKTEVFFKKLDIMEIKDYINTGEPMDKAGAYGIQNHGALFVEKINGDYFNVVGLPICRLCQILKKDFGLHF